MAIFRPGTGETDPYKINLSLQAIASAADTNTTNIATNTANIATNTADIATANTNIAALQALVPLSKITASLGSDTAISNSVYSDGPSVAQGTSGTWFASGTITATDTAAVALISAKLWDGTTVIASAQSRVSVANGTVSITLSGYITTPAANIRISCTSNAAGATSTFKFNSTGNSKDCTLSALRIA